MSTDKEVNITLEDQQKINKFARLNNALEGNKEDIKQKKNEMQNLDDASTDLMMLEDDDELVPYQVGEVFFELTQTQVQEEIDRKKDEITSEISSLEEKIGEIQGQMSDLKTQLYAKFGNSINLEADEE